MKTITDIQAEEIFMDECPDEYTCKDHLVDLIDQGRHIDYCEGEGYTVLTECPECNRSFYSCQCRAEKLARDRY